jgi:hypothetical protein
MAIHCRAVKNSLRGTRMIKTWTNDLFAIFFWGYFGNFLLILLTLFMLEVKLRHVFQEIFQIGRYLVFCFILL